MEDKIECTGKGVFTLIMGLICLTMAIYLLIITIKMEQIIVLAYLIVILAFGLAIYYLLYWKNKKIVMSRNEITYYPILGKVRTYSWNDVRKVRYASGARGSKIFIRLQKRNDLVRMEIEDQGIGRHPEPMYS